MCVVCDFGGVCALQEARQRAGVTTVRTGGVLGTLSEGAAAVRGLGSKKAVDTSMPAMTTSKPVFQVGSVYLASSAVAVLALGGARRSSLFSSLFFVLLIGACCR